MAASKPTKRLSSLLSGLFFIPNENHNTLFLGTGLDPGRPLAGRGDSNVGRVDAHLSRAERRGACRAQQGAVADPLDRARIGRRSALQ